MRVASYEGLESPSSAFRVVLLHGSDRGRIERIADTLTCAVAGSLTDPFRVVALGRDDAGFDEELGASSLSGGRRVIRVEDCTDRSIRLLSTALDGGPDCLVIALAGALTRRSKLREWAEMERQVASVTCEPEGVNRRCEEIRAVLGKSGQVFTARSMAALAGRLPADWSSALGDSEKLSLYVGAARVVSEKDINATFGEGLDVSVLAVVDRVLVGDGAGAMLAFDGAAAAGASGVGVIRVLGSDLLRIARGMHGLREGLSKGASLQRARIFQSDPRRGTFEQALSLWQPGHVTRALFAVQGAELQCKQTGTNEFLATGRLLAAVSRLARDEA